GAIAIQKRERMFRVGPFEGEDAHAAVSHDDRHARNYFGHWEAPRVARLVHCDTTVHFLIGNWTPFAFKSYFGSLIGGAVESFGEGTCHIGNNELAILVAGGAGPVIANLSQDLCQSFLGWR